MLEPRFLPRQIDHLFGSEGIEPVSGEMVLDRALDGMYPSDHFGLLARIRFEGVDTSH